VDNLWGWITTNAQAVTAIAAAIGALFTALYLIATVMIFNEARKSADAAQMSADAADKSADAAQRSVALMRQQFEEQAGLGIFTVNSAIDTAINGIEGILQPQPLRNWSVPGNHSRLSVLLEQRAEPAINYAVRSDAEVAKQLSSAFDMLRTALSHLQAHMDAINRNIGPGHSYYQLSANQALQSLKEALARFILTKHTLTVSRFAGIAPSSNDIEAPKP
jgi:hypothetical protein